MFAGIAGYFVFHEIRWNLPITYMIFSGHSHIPYRTKIRRTKVSKFQLGVENFVRRNILSVENFVQYFNTKVRQKSDKTVEISAWCRKFCPTKYFVRRKFCPTKFCPIRYFIQMSSKSKLLLYIYDKPNCSVIKLIFI